MTDVKNDTSAATSSQGDQSSSDDTKMILITKDGLEKLQEELKYLKEVKRKEVAERIKEAISYGDLSENSEYEESKNEQAFLEGRIMELEDKVKFARIIDDRAKTKVTVRMGSTVVIQNVSKKGMESEEYTIVGSTEADPLNHKISNESPVGNALLDKKTGDTVKVIVPAGVYDYKLLKIK